MSFLVAVLPHLNIQMRKLQPQSFVKSNNAALLLTMFLFCNSCNPPEMRLILSTFVAAPPSMINHPSTTVT